ncbi:BTAD domain-containing putative transcriptional regulator [Streptomyces sp. NBC_00829]|uniref:BTAD domain-containing putative transcriptional regulator n=1 Tax=Streptomyces sp. NBC_00829 TaxID=2903679 RepID=UPI00386EE781|nr:AAA family ATPase [Streptomyces sp. NBC_00829]
MRYLILGLTEARDQHGAELPLGGPRLRRLLAVLALRTGRVVSVGELVAGVWDGDEPHDAPAALQALVGRLRRALGKDAVQSAPGGYRLAAAEDDVDLFVFETLTRRAQTQAPQDAARTLRTALALWRGPALADLPDGEYGARPEAQRLAAVQQRVEADLARGAAEGLVPELQELTAAHPYHEPFRALLIRALRADGRQADALVAYEEARRALADGLGADPGPELTALHRELLETPAPPDPQPRGNLRPRLTSFVGRDSELSVIRADLTRSRLVTLTGPGGSGKTRLAEEAAPAADDGAWLVELAPLDDPAALPGAVLSALGLRETTLIAREGQQTPADPTDRLIEHLTGRAVLLVLDNCEHLVAVAAGLAETLLTHCPRLRILATSREPLGVPGELVRPVDPLPDPMALRLLAERGAAARPGFRTEDDPEASAEICHRLDGLPLAIELAAARLRMLTPRQIADRLDDRFRLLTSGSRTVLPRQQTLRAVVDWSWDLLEEPERTLLRGLAVFAGGWDLPAAEAVCGDAAEHLGALVDKSLVTATPTPDGEMRYRLLETIHEYANKRAAEAPGVRAAAARAHTEYFAALVEEADPRLRSADQLPWIRRLEADLDNIRAALHRAVVESRDEASALRLVFGMGWFWGLRNYRPEGLSWVDRTVDLAPEPDGEDDPRHWPRMHLRMLQFFLAMESRGSERLWDNPETMALLRRVRDAFSRAGPEAARFPGLLWPMASFLTDDTADVRLKLEAAVANCREHGGEWEYGAMLMFRTHLVVDMPGGMPGVDDDLVLLRELSRRVGDRWMRAQTASAAAEAGMMRGRYAEAKVAYEEALALAREVGAHADSPFLIGRLAELSFRAGDTDAAEKGFDEASQEAERYNVADARSYVAVMRAVIALYRGEHAEARRMIDKARAHSEHGSPPVHFEVVMDGLDARLAAYEPDGPRVAVRGLAAALRRAWDARCAEFITAHLADSAAVVLPLLGQLSSSVRLMAAADSWRVGSPRSVPERLAAEGVLARAYEELGAERYEEERATGRALTVPAAVGLLEAAAGAGDGQATGAGDVPGVVAGDRPGAGPVSCS